MAGSVGGWRRWRALYLGGQALAVAAWWGLLWSSPELIRHFHNDALPDGALLDLWLADGVLVFGGSAAAAYLVRVGSPRQTPVLWSLSGAMIYSTLVCLGGSLRSGGGWLAVGLMLPATVLTVLCAVSTRD